MMVSLGEGLIVQLCSEASPLSKSGTMNLSFSGLDEPYSCRSNLEELSKEER